jgi:UDP-N-acetylmuramyl pentapeptide synthase
MATETTLMTAGAMAKELGASDAKIKKALKELEIVPAQTKGCCNYYTPDDLKKVQANLK